MRRITFILSSSWVLAAAAFCQTPDAPGATETRAGQIEADRQAKQAAIPPDAGGSGKTNPLLSVAGAFRIWNVTQAGAGGLTLRLGGLAYNSGFALGPEYTLKRGDIYDPGLVWASYIVGSLAGYYRAESRVSLPRLLNHHAFLNAEGFRFDYPRLDFYGPGPTSSKSGRSDYRMKDSAAEIRGGARLGRGFRIGLVGSYERIRIDPGTHDGIGQTAANYTPQQAPGINLQTEFLSGGFFAEYEGRDQPLDPHSGTYMFTQFRNIDGTQHDLGGFNQYDLQAQQYVPFWNKRRVVALRFKAALTAPHNNTFVPFYLEPRLGGPDDLRGFHSYRYYDQNSVVATAEYRWTVVEALDMALFADAGKVYHSWDTFTIAHMQSDVGFGLRAKADSSVPFRLDIGVSREGVQLWLSFYNVF